MQEKKQVIIVDDDQGVLDASRLILERAGHDVQVFLNGDVILRNNFKVPHLFLLDKQLPGVDGLDICRFLKQQERTRSIPVIILSASPQISNICRQAGADEFLEKPFRMQELKELVAKYI